MAITDQIITTLVDAVAALNTRVDDLSAQKAIPGPQGERGLPGERGEDAPPVSDEQIKAAATEWLAANITQPKDGEPGPQGEKGDQGERGPAPSDETIRLAVEIWFEANADRLRGPRGERGPVGPAGADGADGRDGIRGPAGDRGADGADGIGIALVEQRDQGSFWITLTDGREFEIELPAPKVRGSFAAGGGFAPVYLSAIDGQTQTALANTAMAMELDTVVEAKQMSVVNGTHITFGADGIYNIQFSAQLHNSDSQAHDVSIWLSRDGIAEPDSCTDITVPSKHGAFNGAAVAAWNFYYRAKANEYCRLMWSTASPLVYIAGLPVRTAPARPATPSIILTVHRVSA